MKLSYTRYKYNVSWCVVGLSSTPYASSPPNGTVNLLVPQPKRGIWQHTVATVWRFLRIIDESCLKWEECASLNLLFLNVLTRGGYSPKGNRTPLICACNLLSCRQLQHFTVGRCLVNLRQVAPRYLFTIVSL